MKTYIFVNLYQSYHVIACYRGPTSRWEGGAGHHRVGEGKGRDRRLLDISLINVSTFVPYVPLYSE